jgi:hypothetical protein
LNPHIAENVPDIFPKQPSMSYDEAARLARGEVAILQPQDGWPELINSAAWHGLAGDFVRLVLPETEGDPAALLLTFLAALGCAVGRSAFYQVEATQHPPNLYVVLVGNSSKARKGTATGRVLDIVKRVDMKFIVRRKCSGLSSGEGLIHAVRDAREEEIRTRDSEQSNGKRSKNPKLESAVVDSGEPDKRLLIVESEFASVLQACGREGNTLSAILRDGWDGSPLRVLARSNKDHCAEPHIAMIGNITIEELQRHLTSTDRANGFGNRILWVCVKRSKLLPHGGNPLDEDKVEELVTRLRKVIEAVPTLGRVQFDKDAAAAWNRVYRELAKESPGLFGTMTARAEAQCVRLATLYAILDCSAAIRTEHLSAAVEVWRYCEDSVRYIFGDATGDETADGIYRMLKNSQSGMAQTEISQAFSKHKSAAELTRALGVLETGGRIACQQVKTNGAPRNVWFIPGVCDAGSF